MPANWAQNDIVQVVIESKVDGQLCLNVLHAKVDSAAAGVTYSDGLQGILGALTQPGGLLGTMATVMAENTEVSRVRAQRVFPTRDPYLQEEFGEPGGREGNCVSPNIAACITKRAAVPGRGKSGRFELPGLIADDISGGFLTADYITALEPLAQKLRGTFPDDTANLDLVWVIPNATNPGSPGEIFTTQVQNTARTMHRRTVGLGQ